VAIVGDQLKMADGRHFEQVAQLLLTNPRNVLHHGKQQNFSSHVTITTPI